MELDIVHDTQTMYRKLLHSMSRPGTISSISGEVHTKGSCHQATFLTALTLLDAEVRFHVVSDQKNLGKVIADYTLAKVSSIEEADYIIVPNGTEEEAIIQAMEVCKIGTLLDPQNNSTWLIELDAISMEGSLTLMGPGIKLETPLQLGVTERFWEMRAEKVKEFPLGIDLIFMDPESLVCVPRTTKVSVTGGVV